MVPKGQKEIKRSKDQKDKKKDNKPNLPHCLANPLIDLIGIARLTMGERGEGGAPLRSICKL